jgi:hypothetical protein
MAISYSSSSKSSKKYMMCVFSWVDVPLGRQKISHLKPLLGCRCHRHVSIERLLGIWSGTPEMHVLKKAEKHREPRFKVYTAAD